MDLTSVVLTSRSRRHRLLPFLCAGAIMLVSLLLSVPPVALAVPPGFPDVPASNPYYAAITDLASRGVINGYLDGDFGPSDPVKRQQFAKMIVLTGGYPVSEADICPFTDVESSGPSSFFPDNYVAVCSAKGITLGKSPTTFDPYSFITRYQVISMVVRAVDDLQPGLLVSPSSGWEATGTWANDPTHGANAARAEYNELLEGLDLLALSPTGNMARGEVAQILHNLLGKLEGSLPTFSLSTSVPGGHGAISRNPNKTTFASGEPVVLTATAAEGYTFAGWGGDATGNANPLTVVMNSDKTITATFTAAPVQQYSLTTSVPDGHGTITRDPNQSTYAAGTSVHLTAVPNEGYVFSQWDGDAGGSTNPLTVVMNSNKTITAKFSAVAPTHYTLTIAALPEEGGTVLADPARTTFAAGESVTIAATPLSGYAFTGWSGDASGSANPLTVIMNSNKSITANFELMYQDLVTGLDGGPGVCSPGSGKLELFWRSTASGDVMQKSYSGGVWAAMTNRDGSSRASCAPAAVAWGENILLVARNSENHMMVRFCDMGHWDAWYEKVPVMASDAAACHRGGGLIYIFYTTAAGELECRSWMDGTVSAATALGGDLAPGSKPAAVATSNKVVHVFARGSDNHLKHLVYDEDHGGWGSWEDLGGTLQSSPAAASWGAGRLDVFAAGAGNTLWHKYLSGGAWSTFHEEVPGVTIASAPAAVSWGPDRIDIFVRSSAGHLWHKWWDGSSWNP